MAPAGVVNPASIATTAEADANNADALIFHDMQVPFSSGIQAPQSDRSGSRVRPSWNAASSDSADVAASACWLPVIRDGAGQGGTGMDSQLSVRLLGGVLTLRTPIRAARRTLSSVIRPFTLSALTRKM